MWMKKREPNLWLIINMLSQFTNVVQQPPNMVQHAIVIIPLTMVALIENVLKIQVLSNVVFSWSWSSFTSLPITKIICN
jgi:hypothetical protein